LEEIRSQRLLVYRIGQIGDTIIALPALWAIRAHFPRAHMAFLGDVHAADQGMPARRVLPESGLFDQWLSYAAGTGSHRSKTFWDTLRTLRRHQFDTLIYLAPRLRRRRQVWRDLLFFRTAGIRQFIGHRGFDSLPHRHGGRPLPVLEHEADHLLRRLELSGIPVPPRSQRSIDLALSGADYAAADRWLDSLGYPRTAPVVGIGPGGKWPSKQWPEARFAEIGCRLIARLGIHPIVFGGPEDSGVANRLITAWGAGSSAAGVLSIRQAAAALQHCDLYLGNDNATMHLAAAVGTPCVAIFAAQDWPGRWYPYGPGHTVLRRSVSCEGCRLTECTKEGLRCLREIGVEEVFAACQDTLARSARARPERRACENCIS
jgi:ADP-heptose:LPS heptosyltransferase